MVGTASPTKAQQKRPNLKSTRQGNERWGKWPEHPCINCATMTSDDGQKKNCSLCQPPDASISPNLKDKEREWKMRGMTPVSMYKTVPLNDIRWRPKKKKNSLSVPTLWSLYKSVLRQNLKDKEREWKLREMTSASMYKTVPLNDIRWRPKKKPALCARPLKPL